MLKHFRNMTVGALLAIALGIPYLQAADVAISALPAGTTLTGTEAIPAVQSAATVKTTPAAIKTYVETGGTVTASDPVLDLTQTWNDGSATFTGLKLNITSTASASGSLLFDVQENGASVFSVRKGQSPQAAAFKFTVASPSLLSSGGGILLGFTGTTTGLVSGSSLGWSNAPTNTATLDTLLSRDAAGQLALRNSTNAQTFRVYNTYTDASNYERGKFEWASNELRIGTEKAGTGSARAVAIQADGVTAISIGTSAIVSIGALNITGGYGLFGNGSSPLYGFRHYQLPTTLTSYTLTAGDSGVFHIANSGSDQTFTMPASPSAGTWYGFKVSASKSSYLRFTANTGQKIRLSGGLSASAGYIRSNTGGSFVYLMYDSTDAEWVAWQQGGTWTIDS